MKKTVFIVQGEMSNPGSAEPSTVAVKCLCLSTLTLGWTRKRDIWWRSAGIKRSGTAFSPATLFIVRISSSDLQWVLHTNRLTGHIFLSTLSFILSFGLMLPTIILNNTAHLPEPLLAIVPMNIFLYNYIVTILYWFGSPPTICCCY